jgi:16S rRNA (uracil1498-N3)-methyltransferase
MPDREHADRCFFLDPAARLDAPRLVAEDEEHLVRVLRARVGERVTAFDGRGGRWELAVSRIVKRAVEFEPLAPPTREPAPGENGAPLDWIEVALPLPRGERAAELVDRLVQLGIASLVPLQSERSQGGRSDLGDGRRARLDRVARAACKQSRRAWLLEIANELSFETWLASHDRRVLWIADPGAPRTLAAAVAALASEPRGTRAAPLALVCGPEGGFTARELDAARAAGAIETALGPHVQRIETAAESAAAIVAQLRWACSR